MRLANLSGRAVILLVNDTAVDVAKVSEGRFGPDLPGLYEDWESFVGWWASLDVGVLDADPFEPASLGPPSPSPRQVFGIGMNYYDHAAEIGSEVPRAPSVFTKYPSCLTGPYDEVDLVAGGSCDWEVEMVVVIGTVARHVPRGASRSHVAGLTVGQDISERIGQTAGPMPQFSLAKSHDGFGPIGPALVTIDELDEPDALELSCSLNGETVQIGSTKNLIFPVDELIHRL